MALQDDGGKGAAKPASEPEIEGNVTFTTANGAITAVDVEITVKAQATRTVRKTMKLSGLDATTLEVPADVTTALGQS